MLWAQSTTETFIKRYIVERTNKAEIWPEEQNEKKRRVVGRIDERKYNGKGHKDGNRHKSRLKSSGRARLVYVFDINRNIPTTWRRACGDFTPWVVLVHSFEIFAQGWHCSLDQTGIAIRSLCKGFMPMISHSYLDPLETFSNGLSRSWSRCYTCLRPWW